MFEDPLQEETLARAVVGLPIVPHAVHAPPTTTVELDKTYADPGGQPAEGEDDQGPYWFRRSEVRHNGAVRCPDCGQVLIAAHDVEVARVGVGFLVCWDMHHPYRLPADVRPCHEGCVVACGRFVVSRS